MAIGRRRFLRTGLVGAATAAFAGAPGCALRALTHPGAAPRARGESPFRHGVASGDPLSDRVILWTRVSPRASELLGSIHVDWWIARDPEAKDVVVRGFVHVGPERDFTVKVDAEGLEPGTGYFYGFVVDGIDSPIGRTRTLAGDEAERAKLAVVSCSNHPHGFFNAYACIAGRDDVDLVVHLGDYLYEYGNSGYGDGNALGRIPDPLHEIVSLEDYRRRHALYKSDPDLQAAHARHPWITVWDDHESANDSWSGGAQNHSADEGDWNARRLAAIRAYHEWMPIRDLPDGLFRSFRIGRLVDLVMLDTRLHGRDAQVGGRDHAGAEDPDRSLLGADQTAWLEAQLSASMRAGTRWRVVGQQVVFTPMRGVFGEFNADAWDGYRANRREILDHLVREGIGDVVILTGDVHSAWALEIPDLASDPRGPGGFAPMEGRSSGAVELVAPAVSSRPFGSHPGARELVEKAPPAPYIRYSNIDENGFLTLELTPERALAEFWFSDPVKSRSAHCRLDAAFEVRAGVSRLERVELTDPMPPPDRSRPSRP